MLDRAFNRRALALDVERHACGKIDCRQVGVQQNRGASHQVNLEGAAGFAIGAR
jgi:hypothetical protein